MTLKLSGQARKPRWALDIRGTTQLTFQALQGLVGVVEAVHQSVWDTVGASNGMTPGRTRGITGLVYRSIRAVTQQAGKGTDAVLAGLEGFFGAFGSRWPVSGVPETTGHATYVSILNGMVGDHLVASGNPLALPMTLRHRGQELDFRAPLKVPAATGKILLLIHGLCMHERQWGVSDDDRTLVNALGYTLVYLRYNSGLHTSQNGRELAGRLELLTRHWPVPIEEISVLAHSMGGLLIRSACHLGRQQRRHWPEKLKHIVFLGTPHHGAPLERAGNWVDTILGSTRYSAPFARIGQLRSAGITDLRHGHVLDEHWRGRNRFHREPDSRSPLPLPEGVRCHALAATTVVDRSVLAGRLVAAGDGLVPVQSALGHHHDPRHNLGFAKGSQCIVYRTGHLGLVTSPKVIRRAARWLAES